MGLPQLNRATLSRLYVRFGGSENTTLLALAVAVGLLSGIGIWLFRLGIEVFHVIFNEWLAHEVLSPYLSAAAVIVALMFAGLIVGWIVHRFVGEERHEGVAGIMESVAFSGGRLRYARMPFKAIASALSLGAGASVGPEDPSVQIGSNLGSMVGQKLRLSEDRVRLLVAAGGASAIAAAFRAPIAGVFFALEVILNGEFTTGSFGAVVLAAVVASIFTQAVEAGGPEFGLHEYTLGGIQEVPLYIVLGLLLAPVAVAFIRAVYWQRDLWHHHVQRLPRPLKTALAGGLVGIVAMFLPQIMGTGREVMASVLSDSSEFTIVLLLILGAAKLIMTAVSMGGGFVGGVFAPSLFIGTMFGAAFGRFVDTMSPVPLVGDPQAYAIAGMAAVMAAVVHAPITAILLVFELTNDYLLILPIMLTTVICIYVAEHIEPHGIYTLGLKRKGIVLQRGRDFDVMQDVKVRDAMRLTSPTIPEGSTLLELRDKLRALHTRTLCVVSANGALTGIVTLSDLQVAYERREDNLTVGDICSRDVVGVTPDETLDVALRKMGVRDFSQLPVLEPGSNRVVGMLSRQDIVRAYNLAIARKIEQRQIAEQVRLHNLTGAHVVDYRIHADAPVDGKLLREIEFPPDSVIASIRRGGQLIVPHGGTVLRAGDLITVVASPDSVPAFEALTGERLR